MENGSCWTIVHKAETNPVYNVLTDWDVRPLLSYELSCRRHVKSTDKPRKFKYVAHPNQQFMLVKSTWQEILTSVQ